MSDFSASRTNLDRYLDDLFSRKLQFSVDSNVIRCLQESVESYVTQLLNVLLKQRQIQAKIKMLRDTYNENHKLFTEDREVLCVGSFYEETKNTFPDEFDYVMVLLTAERLVQTRYTNTTRKKPVLFSCTFLESITDFCFREVKDLTDYAIKLSENPYFIMDLETSEQIGPAVKLRFSIRRRMKEVLKDDVMYIHVDVTLAIRVKDSFLPLYVDTLCPIKEFCEELLRTGSFIVVHKQNTQVSFTETEVRFMKTCLSVKHRRVYRLLKYFINGDLDESKLRAINSEFEEQFCKRRKYDGSYFKLSSYILKILLINHHFKCTNKCHTGEATCLLNIIKTLQCYVRKPNGDTVCIPGLSPKDSLKVCSGNVVIRFFEEELAALIDTLTTKATTDSYSYDYNFIEPLSKRMYAHLYKMQVEVKRAKCRQKAFCFSLLDLIFLVLVFFKVLDKTF